MERVWRRVQSAGRRGAAATGAAASLASPASSSAKSAAQHVAQDQQQHHHHHHHHHQQQHHQHHHHHQQQQQQQQQQQRPRRKGRGPQTIVCGCQVQPCPVHPVLIRVRRSQRPPPPNCDCPQDKQPCVHAARPAGPRRLRRCDCAERPCRHVATSTRRRPQGLSSLFLASSSAGGPPDPSSQSYCPHGDDEVCDCQGDAPPCAHTVKSSRPRRGCDCPGPACPHRALEGRIKRVKCRVRRAGCAMARCTAELAMLHLHWELASECAPCRPRALTRRLCRRQQSDNELYRSNSFKFERFERSRDECSTPMRKQVSLCDDYSLPVDFVNKKRPVSVPVPATTVQWTLPSPTVETAEIEVVEQYSDPRDSKNRAFVEPSVDSPQPAIYAKANRNYCRPYTDPSASGSSCEDEEVTGRLSSTRKRKNTVYATSSANRNPSVQERERRPAGEALPSGVGAVSGNTGGLLLDGLGLLQLQLQATASPSERSPTESLPSRHPSPYYYGDLFKPSGSQTAEHRHHNHHQLRRQLQQQHPTAGTSGGARYLKSASLDVPGERSRSLGLLPKTNSLTEGDGALLAPREPLEERRPSPEPELSLELSAACSLEDEDREPGGQIVGPEPQTILSRCIITEWDHTLMPPHRLLSHDLPTTVCTCLASAEEDDLEPPSPPQPTASVRPLSARHKVRKLRRSRRVEPQPILIEDRDDEAELEDEGDEEYEDDEEEDEEMARQRQIYETAFDCKVSRSDDDLDDLDRMTNHPLLISQMRNSSTAPLSRASSSTESSKQSQQTLQSSIQPSKDHRRKVVVLRPKALIPSRVPQQPQSQSPQPAALQSQSQQQQPPVDNVSSLSQDIESLQINSNDEKSGSPRLTGRGYTPSPPSTAPLPAKFHGREQLLLNMRSAPNLPSQQQQQPLQSTELQPRLKDVRLPVKSSLRPKELSPQSSENSILEIKGRPKSSYALEAQELILEFKGRPSDDGVEAVPTVQGRPRPRSLVRESKPIMEFKGRPHEAESAAEASRARREQQASLLEIKLRTSRRRAGYSSTESMATSSSGGSMESLRSSTSEGNRSTSSSESRHSTSLSSHSSDSGSTGCIHHHHHHNNHHHHHSHSHSQQQQSSLSSFLAHHATKLHILSPISDKSSQEPASETSDNNRNNNSQKPSPEELNPTAPLNPVSSPTASLGQAANSSGNPNNPATTPTDTSFKKRRAPQNKNLINLALQSSSSGDAEIQGSDSGISIESRAGIKCNKPFSFQPLKPPGQQPLQLQLDNLNQGLDNEQELSDLPFDMPKLRRRRLLQQQDATTSGSATSVDLKDLPFDMPKLRRRLRCTQSTESSASQASSSLSVRDVEPPALFGGGLARPKMTLNLDGGNGVGLALAGDCGTGQLAPKKPAALNLGLPLDLNNSRGSADLVDAALPLERQGWYHGSITRIEAEAVLRLLREGSYLVRNSESTKQDYSLSLKSARGFMHMRIQKNDELNAYILGQFSKPFDSIPEMVRHFSINRLPIRGAEHMCLLHPVIAQLL